MIPDWIDKDSTEKNERPIMGLQTRFQV
ncbi:hypothetical protein PROAA_1480006 [Candidatus Propionivibrio aalborgensis]|uniref:Uncharacterized protein n=1 Tax=Candidatus Propionivibrio aalborgensis TaxID=1860101 RepID=A0A1A8XJE4_9RHOO|nr:hypothetical protein PROAA_1480006 [Candidatus Propionivibrio aalborgensis]